MSRNKFGSLPVRAIRKIMRGLGHIAYKGITALPYFRFIRETAHSNQPIFLTTWFSQKIVGFNRSVYWPVHFTSRVASYKSIIVGRGSYPGIMPGCYIQGLGKIYIGDFCYFAPNVGIISANHVVDNLATHARDEVVIGSHCWVGMNAVILPGVVLGDNTTVGAGSVVTKSFSDGNCVLAGNPARKIRALVPKPPHEPKHASQYIGYIHKDNFAKFRADFLWI